MIPDINLLPNLEKRQSDSKLLYILIGIIVLLLLSFFIWQYFNARAQIVVLEKEETNLITQRDQLQSKIDSVNQKGQGSLAQSIKIVELLSYPVSPIIDEAKALQPSNSYLREYIFEERNVTITIDFETLKEVSQYVSRLTKSPYFKDGQVVSITNYELSSENTDETNFDIVPRQTVEISLLIDENFLATGGVQ